MKILVTGANGLLGQKLVDLILRDGSNELIATSKGFNRNTTATGYSYDDLDITRGEDVIELVGSHRPDVVINTAAMTNVDQCESNQDGCWNLNVNAVQNLIEACTLFNSRLIHLSTDFIFDGLDGPYKEEVGARPLNYYGESKLASEQLVTKSRINWAIARTVLVYGIVKNMSRSNIVLWVKDALQQGKELKIVNDQWRTPTLAEDLAMGCYLIATKNAKGIFHISGKELMTPYELAIRVADYFKLDKSLIEKADGSGFTQPARRPAKTGFIVDKAKKDLGYSPHTFDQGLQILESQLGKITPHS